MDLRFAMLESLIANVNRDPKKAPTAYKPEEFMPEFGGDAGSAARGQDWQTQLQMVEMLNTAFGGTDTRTPALSDTEAA